MDLLAQKLYNERFFPVLPRFFEIVIGFLREKIVCGEWWTLGKTNAMTQQCHFKLTQICFLYSYVPDIIQILSSSFYAYQQHILEMLSKGSAFFRSAKNDGLSGRKRWLKRVERKTFNILVSELLFLKFM